MAAPPLAAAWHALAWSGTELLLYFVSAGLLAGGISATVWAVALLARHRGTAAPFAAAWRATSLVAFALLFGAPACLAFTARFRYRAYIPGDPFTDWVPFFPTGAWVVDPGFNGRFLEGHSPATVAVGWLVFAIPVWLAAAFCTVRYADLLWRRIRRAAV